MAFAWLTAEARELLGHHFAGAADFLLAWAGRQEEVAG